MIAAAAIPDPDRNFPMTRGERLLMSIDAVGGVWRYAMDLALSLKEHGHRIVFAGFGPAPSRVQLAEAQAIGPVSWSDTGLDWMVATEEDLNRIPAIITALVRQFDIDLIHLNAPSQACGLDVPVPIVAASHSCVVSWFEAVRGGRVPQQWAWHERRNRMGFDNADVVLAPSHSHAAALRRCYGPIDNLEVVANACSLAVKSHTKEMFAFAAARWWDEGKNGSLLDRAAAQCRCPVVMVGACEGPNGARVVLKNAAALGELPHHKVAEILETAAIFVSPSLYEPFGLAALEAARSGAALVLADIPTYREIWEGSAVFADPHDPESFSRAIDRLAEENELRTALAARAIARSCDFSLENQFRGALQVYARALRRVQAVEAECP